MLKNAVHTIQQQREVIARRGALYRLFLRPSNNANPDLVAGFPTFDSVVSYFHQKGYPVSAWLLYGPELGFLEIWRGNQEICSGVQLGLYILTAKRPTLSGLEKWLRERVNLNGESS